ncbi:Flavonol synthase/flavanone 3-hydroxylase, putative [Ricinus communis]|uniref:Flavonol synthase/flavanone 3-hydroxylase, putative n=1 Tax=Ricinus communis TaxID=3988 RepID=B9SNS2_RICCO|nr:Flavonol synthase/flavanone 3-hydroxylase, putative [Ricinus communis]
MENKHGIKNFGGSLPVENVQALSSKNLKEVPIRYIRPELEFDEFSMDESLQIPVIDMSKLKEDQSSHNDELAQLHIACRNWGFFQLINHGVSEEVMENMKMDIQEFFKLPFEEKMAFAQLPNNIEGYGQAFVVSDEQKLDWGDMLFLLPLPASSRKMRFWPTNPTSFGETFDKYSSELQRIAVCILRLMARNLGIDPEDVATMFEDGVQGIRMNYYPPCIQANKVIGLTTHSDATGLTLLTQVNEVQGLQIKKDGRWVPITPIPGAFIINVGDIIEIMSNGEYRSIEHRAVVNPEKERLSIAAFHNPDIKTMIGPLGDLVKGKKPNYKTITHEEFVKLVVTSKLDGKLLVGHMKVRSEV